MKVETPQIAPLVRMRGVVKSFAGVTVVDHVDLDLHPGQVHVLAGENGAGKSTLMKVLAGIHQPDAGSVEIDGEEIQLDVRAAKSAGIAIVHQELLLAPNLSVADNLAMGREFRTSTGVLDRSRTTERARDLLARVGATFSPATRVEKLSTGQQQLVEIARALADDPKVLIFDEPSAALSAREVANLFAVVRDLRSRGTAIAYITHRMDEIAELADVVTILRDGRHVDTLPIAQASPDVIVTKMVGREIASLFPDGKRTPGAVVLSAEGVGDGADIGPIDLEVHAGEVLGIAGLVGSGRSEFARLVFGADTARTGRVTVDGVVLKPWTPRGAMRAGVALVPESRKEQGLVLGRSVSDNVMMSSYGRVSASGVLRRREIRSTAQSQRDQLGIRLTSVDQEVRNLSGGNQQKVLLSKWLRTEPKVLILDEPTRGVDVGAKADIYTIINDCAAAGMAIIVISSELPELLGLVDRIVVMREGRLVASMPNVDLTEEAVMEHAFGLAASESSTHTRPSEAR